MESCVVVTQRKPALVLLVHMKHPVLDARSRRRSPRTAVLRVRVRDVLIRVLARGGGRRWVRLRPVGLVRRLDVAEPAVDRCGGELAACWSSMDRRRNARGGGSGGGTGG